MRRALWPIAQTAVAAGLSYFIAHSLVGHVQPFFAPIAATVTMSTTTDLRAQRAGRDRDARRPVRRAVDRN